ncbi:hypothetical protein ACJX0J_029260, partial [Zea mays]
LNINRRILKIRLGAFRRIKIGAKIICHDNEDKKNEIIIEGLENKIKDLEASLEKKDFLEELDNTRTILNKKYSCALTFICLLPLFSFISDYLILLFVIYSHYLLNKTLYIFVHT